MSPLLSVELLTNCSKKSYTRTVVGLYTGRAESMTMGAASLPRVGDVGSGVYKCVQWPLPRWTSRVWTEQRGKWGAFTQALGAKQ